MASAYNGLLQNPLFTGVLGVELSETKAAGRTSLPANLIGGAVGYAVFLALGMPSLAGILGLEPVKHIRALDVLLILVTALLGIALAAVSAVLFKVATRVLGRFRDDVGRALAAGVVFSLAGAAAPILMFSGESQVQTVVEHPARYGAALLLVMALAKLALLAVAFRGGFLGGAIFPSIFALVCVALALDLSLRSAGKGRGADLDAVMRRLWQGSGGGPIGEDDILAAVAAAAGPRRGPALGVPVVAHAPGRAHTADRMRGRLAHPHCSLNALRPRPPRPPH